MNKKLICKKLAGGCAWVNDAKVSFDAEGLCLGIVQFVNMPALEVPVPLRPQDIDKLVSVAGAIEEGTDLGDNSGVPGDESPVGDNAIPKGPPGQRRKPHSRNN